MIQANEVRIGNLVEFNGEVFEIESISRDLPNIKLDSRGIGVVPWVSLNGVTLTEEWLVKFGFVKNESPIADSFSKSISSNNSLKELCVYINKGNEYIFIREGEQSYPTTVDAITTILNADYHGRPFFVHQLQNLYFALTAQELTLTPNETHNN